MNPEHPSTAVDRRALLVGAGTALVLAACGADTALGGSSPATASGEAGSGSSTSSSTGATGTAGGPTGAGSGQPGSTGAAATPFTAADFDALGSCRLLPEKTAGPFPLDQQFVRRDITEGYPGHPLRLGLRVLDEGCAPVPGAAVELWHADATGDYSAFADGGGGKDEAAGSTFLRGTQVAGDDGIVEFLTVYPGWYRGRAVHIHLRVHLDDELVLTSQLFFDESYTAAVYAEDPYAEFGPPDTSNARDGIAGEPSAEGTLLVTTAGATSRGAGTVGLLNVAIDPSARSTEGAGRPVGAGGRSDP